MHFQNSYQYLTQLFWNIVTPRLERCAYSYIFAQRAWVSSSDSVDTSETPSWSLFAKIIAVKISLWKSMYPLGGVIL